MAKAKPTRLIVWKQPLKTNVTARKPGQIIVPKGKAGSS